MNTETQNTTTPKQPKTPLLRCIVTNTERLTNRKYLESKAAANGISVQDYLGLFISRPALKLLRAGKTVDEARAELKVENGQPLSAALIERAIKVNGKHKKS